MLEIRLPIGAFFGILGLLLIGYGLFNPPEPGLLQVNVWWGLSMLVFGSLMFFFGWRSHQACMSQGPESKEAENPVKPQTQPQPVP